MKKYKISILIALFIIFNLFSYSFAQDKFIIHDKITEEILTKGVTRTNIHRFTNEGWLNINVIKADLSNKNINVELFTDPRGINYMSNVLQYAQNNDAVAAINADFFQKVRGVSDRGSSIGPIVKNGNLISNTSKQQGMSSILIDNSNNVIFKYWDIQLTITAPNGNSHPIKYMNKYDSLDSIVLYDRNWGTKSMGSSGSTVEVVVEDNIVKDIRRNMEPVEIPENGYILTTLTDYNTFLIDNFKIGDPIKLDISAEPNFENLKYALGAGTLLVKDGEIQKFTDGIKGVHPRTAIGVDASGKTFYMVTVDGRQLVSKGMSELELANLMIELGAYNAVNLDGGGSTTLVSKSFADPEIKVINYPSDGFLRKVINSIGITTSAPKEDVYGLLIESKSKNIFVNTSRSFTVKAYDKNFNPVDIDINKIKWSVSGVKGKFKNNKFFPTSTGHGTITATYKNISSNYNIKVLDLPSSITINTKNINIKSGQTLNLYITGKDSQGYSAPINLSDVKWNIPKNICTIEDNYIKGLKSGNCIITASFGQVNTHAIVNVDSNENNTIKLPDDITLPDPLNKNSSVLEGKNNFSFSVFSDTLKRDTLAKNLIMIKTLDKFNKNNNIATFVSQINSTDKNNLNIPYIDITKPSLTNFKESTFITLNNKNNGLRASDAKQWLWLKENIKNIKSKNIFILLPRPLESNVKGGFKDIYELQLFKDTLYENLVKQNKNVFVFYNNDKFNINVENGIRYIGTPKFPNTTRDLSKFKYIEVIVNGENVTYQEKNVFDIK
ncbi:phosphodiester glycosidase family protein [Tepidibacter thalassicus]|uniref:Phosphodiester glycosidase domain-containing protein n=1 Tax=Tepidibacter thalassicus DSM 15285 TaxID=1123350 RepID=A0A1M5TE29_9FIRM|nr:phosphodiester glycosidase family protein [Tepidibacter thalassicus]SHH48573.1 Predicted protein [Tepidibacter thalassicus DSM 15285]